MAPSLTTDQVWDASEKEMFAVLDIVTSTVPDVQADEATHWR